LRTLVFVIAGGVMVRPTFSVTTKVAVNVRSGAVMDVVAVAFSMLVLVTSIAEMDSISVTFTKVVVVTSGAVIKVLAVSFSTIVVVVYAVTTGMLLVIVLDRADVEGVATIDALMADEMGPQV
jgi:hypothetical protein